MAIRTYDILLDSYNSTIPDPIVGRQGDKNGAVTLHVTITDRGTAVDLTGQTVNLIAETAKGTAVVADNTGVTLTDAANGKFDYAIPNALWSEAGKITKAYFSLNDTDGQETTYDLIFIVKKAIDISQKSADDYVTIIDGTIRDLKTKVDAIYTNYQSGNFYNKSETDSKDAATLSSANAYADNSLKGISSVPETFTNLAAIQSKYPNGSNGIMVAADNGHKYIWSNSAWTDAGIYQAVGIADGSVGWNKLTKIGSYAQGIAGYGSNDNTIVFDKKNNTITIPKSSVIKNGLDYYEITNDVVLDVSSTNEVLNGSSVFTVYYDVTANAFSVAKYQFAPTENVIWIASGRNSDAGKMVSIFPVKYLNAPIDISTNSTNKIFDKYFDDVYQHGYFMSQAKGNVLKPFFNGTFNRLLPAQEFISIDNAATYLRINTTADYSIAIYFYDSNYTQLTDSGWINGNNLYKLNRPAEAVGFTFTIKNRDDSFVEGLSHNDIWISTDTDHTNNIIDSLFKNAANNDKRNNFIRKLEHGWNCLNDTQTMITQQTGTVSTVNGIENNVKLADGATVTMEFPMIEDAFFEFSFQWQPSAIAVNQKVELKFDSAPPVQYNGAAGGDQQIISLNFQTRKICKYRVLAPLGTTKVSLTFTGAQGTTTLFSVLSQLKVKITRTVSESSNVEWIPHRGCSLVSPENTMTAFKNAAELGFKYIETDLAVTNDGNWLISHDYDISRCSNGAGNITTHSTSWAKGFDYGSKFDSRFVGTTIPDIEEVIRFARTTGVIPVIEFKNGKSDQPVGVVLDLLKKYNMYDKVIINSFDFETLQNINTLLANKPTILGYLRNTVSQTEIDQVLSLNRPGTFLNVQFSGLTKDIVNLSHDNKIPIYAWTIDSIDDAISAIEMGVDSIISDHLNLAGCIF